MIRAAWFLLVATFATLAIGPVILGAAILRIRGRIYDHAVRLWCRILWWSSGCRLRIHGASEVDWTRPQIIVCNHPGSFEILALALAIPVPFHFIVKKELEKIPLFGRAWQAAGHISIDRENRERAIESLRHASSIIHDDGGAIVIFPEGTRSGADAMQPFKKGAFVLAMEAQVPILPAVAIGSEAIYAPGKLHITPSPLDLYFGKPLSVEGIGPDEIEDLMGAVRARMEALLAANAPAREP